MLSKYFLPSVLALLAILSGTAACDAGSAPIRGACTFCPVGTYALAGAAQCTRCPAGWWAPINSVSKDACYPLASGTVPPSGHCDAGSAPKNGVCTFCPVGTYALAGAPQCTRCPAGWWAPINSVSKDACYPLPTVAAAATTLRGFAFLCDAGSAPINGACTFCPVGTYALAAAAQCTPCPDGFWAPINSVSPDACYPIADSSSEEEVHRKPTSDRTKKPHPGHPGHPGHGHDDGSDSGSKDVDSVYPAPVDPDCDAGSAPVTGVCVLPCRNVRSGQCCQVHSLSQRMLGAHQQRV